ncbi:hypothetical protein JHK84_055145 [Glycine max]|nr:hypothetical protein JHK85_056094 [Glycine max]KAG5073914.1 hypothetical protein JHK84_055145 [Glycine max]
MKSLLPPSVDQWTAMQVMGSLTGKVARAPAWTVVAAEKCAEKGEISPERRAASKSTHRNAEIGHWKEDDKWKGLTRCAKQGLKPEGIAYLFHQVSRKHHFCGGESMRERDCECEGARCGEAVEVMVECEERRIRDLDHLDYGFNVAAAVNGSKLTVMKSPTDREIKVCYELGHELGCGEFGITFLYHLIWLQRINIIHELAKLLKFIHDQEKQNMVLNISASHICTTRQGNELNAKQIKEYRQKVELELSNICNDVMRVIDEHLIPLAAAGESTVFYYKM